MPEYLDSIEGVACRACGAVRGPFSDCDNSGIEWTLCANCWVKFERWASRGLSAPDGPYSDDDVNRWLARKLVLDLRRLEKTGILGRCEVASDWLYGRQRGAQCALPAIIKTSDGRLLCSQHLRSPRHTLSYVGAPNSNSPYNMLGHIIEKLVKRDKKLLETITAAIGLDAQPWSRLPHNGRPGSSPIDLFGRTFGKLTVIARIDDRVGKGRHRYWRCRCECGAEKEIRCDALLNGYHLSCGCHRAAASRARATSQSRTENGEFIAGLPGVTLS